MGLKIKTDILNLRGAALICGLILLKALAFAGGIEDIHVLKISSQDERAVIKTPDGKMKIIKAGDALGEHVTVSEIAPERVVLKEKKGNDTETVIIRLQNGKQRIERIRKKGERQPLMYAPQPETTGAGKKKAGKTN